MLGKLWWRIEGAERRWRRSWGRDRSTPSARFWGRVHYYFMDHAILRTVWTNFWTVSHGVWRSNQPTETRFRRYAKMGVRTVVNLRGEDDYAHYWIERDICDALGMTLVDAKLWARKAAPRSRIVAVIDALRAAERPMMFHCKSGADRAGFVAAMYQMVFDDMPVAEARKQLGLKYIHLDFTKTGVQDYILDVFEARQTLGPIGFEDWIRTEYAPGPIQQGWDARRPPTDTARALVQ